MSNDLPFQCILVKRFLSFSFLLLLLLLRIYSQLQPIIPWYIYINNLANWFLFVYYNQIRSIVFKPMIGLFAKVPKDFDSLRLSNCFRNILMPLVSHLRSVLSAQSPMENSCNTIMSTLYYIIFNCIWHGRYS